ncbi:hypothetical protein GAYE_SCF27MG4699 [Galdieria yellowstonensis]|uniref:Uncharacterized protein n=1 Tax=Galdieria yellowstonensis TaxID=3028027 RepID=A0AAV9IH34_9RHOD|nr:hypothetical protein GAYE_SCF27MG4699 [Galdieria yellowstonensis]
MKQSYSNVAFFAIVACVAYITVAAAMPPPPPPPPLPSPTVSNTESGSSTQGIQYGPSGAMVFESQTGSSQGNAGNYQFSSGEDTLAVPYEILSGNGASEGSTGVLKIPFVSPALPQFNTLLPEPQLLY